MNKPIFIRLNSEGAMSIPELEDLNDEERKINPNHLIKRRLKWIRTDATMKHRFAIESEVKLSDDLRGRFDSSRQVFIYEATGSSMQLEIEPDLGDPAIDSIKYTITMPDADKPLDPRIIIDTNTVNFSFSAVLTGIVSAIITVLALYSLGLLG